MLFRPFLYDPTTAVESGDPTIPEFRLYPNPANNRVTLELPHQDPVDGLSVEIFDVSGRMVRSVDLFDRSMDISMIPEGIYFLRVRAGEIYYSSRLLINR